MTPRQGEIWRWEPEDVTARPVLILTRDEVIPLLSDIVVAPVTRTRRDIPTEVHLGRDCGLAVECAASFDNVFAVSRAHLVQRVGELPDERRHELCDAMRAVIDC
jgi:mRNA interferase MazF